ncbi:UPF0688 protein C1orf174 homolog [Genypterus blacodes]|uniref:UPF0688 protein C1orf174 homolog n=1 Tax=Genypterus blacodes TaxID=154954 RepID=UPI003F75E65C
MSGSLKDRGDATPARRPEMPGQNANFMNAKRKKCSESRSSRKATATRRRADKRTKTHSATIHQQSNSIASAYSNSLTPLERLSRITCECHLLPGSRRCSASPQLEGQEGKENEATAAAMAQDRCRVHFAQDRQETEQMDYQGGDKSVFLDDDSNQILPVEQFFGNLDIVQDFPQRSSVESVHDPRKIRRRHYYAKEDNDDEDVGESSTQQDDTGDT